MKLDNRAELVESLREHFKQFPFDVEEDFIQDAADGVITVSDGFPIYEEDVYRGTGLQNS